MRARSRPGRGGSEQRGSPTPPRGVACGNSRMPGSGLAVAGQQQSRAPQACTGVAAMPHRAAKHGRLATLPPRRPHHASSAPMQCRQSPQLAGSKRRRPPGVVVVSSCACSHHRCPRARPRPPRAPAPALWIMEARRAHHARYAGVVEEAAMALAWATDSASLSACIRTVVACAHGARRCSAAGDRRPRRAPRSIL